MKSFLIILAMVTCYLSTAQDTINSFSTKNVYYGIDGKIRGEIKHSDWDIAIDPGGEKPQGNYSIRINEAVGTRVWVNTTDLRDNCTLDINCRGLQDYQTQEYDTTGMAHEQNGWLELHNGYARWSEGALNQYQEGPITDIVSYGWGAYRAFNTNPAHAIIGYRIFVIKLRNGQYKQFFVRKSLASGFEYAFANLDGSKPFEDTLQREDYSDKIMAYISLVNQEVHNPEPPRNQWQMLFTQYPPNKPLGNFEQKPAILINATQSASRVKTTAGCSEPDSFSDTINCIGTSWQNEGELTEQHHYLNNLGDSLSLQLIQFNGTTLEFNLNTYERNSMSAYNTQSNENCFECKNGTAQVLVNGGHCPYEITWNDADTNFVRKHLMPGIYTYTLKDNKGNTIKDSIEIHPYTCVLELDSTQVINPTCYQSSNGQIQLHINNQSINYQVQWQNGQNGDHLNHLNAGSYTYTIQSDDGCQKSGEIILVEPDSLYVEEQIRHETCPNCNNASITLNPSGANGNYTVLWDDGDQRFNRDGLSPGVYSYQIMDAKQCPIEGEISLLKFGCKLLIGRSSINNPSCSNSNDGSIEINPEFVTGEMDFFWSHGLPNQSEQTGLAAGQYQVIIQDETNCTDTANFTLVAPEELRTAINMQEPCDTCPGKLLIATAEGGTPPYLYVWNTQDSTQQIVATESGEYSVRVSDKNQCASDGIYQLDFTHIWRNKTVSKLTVYPNPFKEFLIVKHLIGPWEIRDGIGRKIMHGHSSANENIRINSSSWIKGVYHFIHGNQSFRITKL